MPEITLDALKSDCAALVERIATYEAKLPRILNIAGAVIELRTGEHYAGEILNADGTLNYRLALVSVSEKSCNWASADDYAKSVGGKRPNLAERGLLIANCKPHLPKEGTFWLDDEYEGNASYAWGCHFGNGCTGYGDKSYGRQAVAVRLIHLEG
jgi:hypothetical protein